MAAYLQFLSGNFTMGGAAEFPFSGFSLEFRRNFHLARRLQ
jgi:hypothetical protein